MNRGLSSLVLAACLLFWSAAPADATVAQKGTVRVSFDGSVAPTALPRHGEVPVAGSVGARIGATDQSSTPQLQEFSIAINSAGRFHPGSVPTCRLPEIQPANTREALSACRRSLVGNGRFAAKILLPAQAAFPSRGKIFAFNGRYRGHPAILVHVFGTKPVPTSFTLPFVISKRGGELGTVLSASLAEATGKAGYITALSLTLGKGAGVGDARQPYLTASCPAPDGFSSVPFTLGKAIFDFGATKLETSATQTCRVAK